MNNSTKIIGICVLLIAAVVTPPLHAQQAKIVSSYGPTNQDVSFDQIKAARMAVKAERAKEHMELLHSRYILTLKLLPESSCREGNRSGRTDGQPTGNDVGRT